MADLQCSEHPGSVATYGCVACARLLCEDCIESGHRLLTCTHCGEMAQPLASDGAVDVKALERERVLGAPYSLRDALLYPVRGQGGFVYLAAVLYLMLLQGLASALPYVGLGAVGLSLMILLLTIVFLILACGLSFSIVRTTAAGDNELPNWPDWSELGERMSEVFAAIVLGFMALLPALALVRLTDCEAALVTADLPCLMVYMVGLMIGLPVWVPGFGAVGLLGNPWLSLRWDLHVRAFLALRKEIIPLALLLAALYAAGGVILWVFSFLPLVGTIVSVAVETYAWLAGMHFVGLLMRRHEKEIEALYLR